MKRLVQAFVVFPPLLAALAAPAIGLMWIMGLSAFSGTQKATAANIGLWALILYFAAYAILAIIVTICVWRKWRIANLFHGLIWLCFIIFSGTMAWSLSIL